MRTFIIKYTKDYRPKNISNDSVAIDWKDGPDDVLKAIDGLLKKHKLQLAVGVTGDDCSIVQIEKRR